MASTYPASSSPADVAPSMNQPSTVGLVVTFFPTVRVVRVYKIAGMVSSAPRLPVPGPSNRTHGSTTQSLARRAQLSLQEGARLLRPYYKQRLDS